MKIRVSFVFILLSYILLVLAACGPRAFMKGTYEDPNEIKMLSDKFNENDMQLLAKKMISSLSSAKSMINRPKKPVVIIELVRNRTSEHVDMKSLTDKIRAALINSGKFTFIEKDLRNTLVEEYDYQDSKYVDKKTAKPIGKQIAADYILSGDLSSIVQQAGKDKQVYYKLNMNVTNITTGIIEWTDEKEIRKAFKKRSVGF